VSLYEYVESAPVALTDAWGLTVMSLPDPGFGVAGGISAGDATGMPTTPEEIERSG
jgi:hypothetical protein